MIYAYKRICDEWMALVPSIFIVVRSKFRCIVYVMAIGFPAEYTVTQVMPFDKFGLERLVEQALATVGWEVIERSNERFVAKVPLSGFSWGERLHVDLADGHAVIRSACYPFQVIDWGKNRRNVETFVAALCSAERSAHRRGDIPPAQLYEKGESVVDRIVRENKEHSD